MRLDLSLGVSLAACLMAAGCASPTTTFKNIAYGDPASAYLGMTKSEVIACAGQPHSRYPAAEGSEILTYHYNGAGPVPEPEKKSGDKDAKKDKPKGLFGGASSKKGEWTCTASLVFENDRLSRVSFAHKDVDSPYAWQSEDDPKKQEEMRAAGVPTCTFSLPNCRR
jgi:hypothetical protein